MLSRACYGTAWACTRAEAFERKKPKVLLCFFLLQNDAVAVTSTVNLHFGSVQYSLPLLKLSSSWFDSLHHASRVCTCLGLGVKQAHAHDGVLSMC